MNSEGARMKTSSQVEPGGAAARRPHKPVVSIAMAVCNVDRFLAEAIESILGQSLQDFELIIVDFGSTDNSLDISARYAAKDARVKLHRAENCSLPEARNKASLLGQGEFIAAADADDIHLPDRLRLGVEFLRRHPKVGLVGAAVEFIDAGGKPLHTVSHPAGNSEIQSALLTQCVLFHPTVLIRREAFVSAGGYRPVFNVVYDYDLWLRIAEHFQIANIERVAVKYRIHSHQDSLRQLRQRTLCKLAAQASARRRRLGQADPLNSATEITPALLAELGVTYQEQQHELFLDYRHWISLLCLSGEDASALRATAEILQSDLSGIERSQIADIHLSAAKIWRREGRRLRAIQSVRRAVMTDPATIGRLCVAALRRLRRL